ncbi:unnamed protein product, partial [Coregonus sp. 'balchen']
YATLAYNEATKNNLDPRERGRVQEGINVRAARAPTMPGGITGDKYLSKCPENDLAFNLHPRRGECIGDSTWYTYWLPSLTDRKRWSNILVKNKENTAAPSTPKRLKQGCRSSSTDSDRYFNQCIIQGNVQINVTYNK